MIKEGIKYVSTNLHAPAVRFSEALLKGIAPDGGLYMPSSFPRLMPDELESLRGFTYPELAARIVGAFTGDEIPTNDLLAICRDIYTFNIPLEPVKGREYIMRLDQGPTASFKDFAALLMGRLMQYFLAEKNRQIIILTATSGDTGSAVANAFSGLDNIKVIILYPAREVTDVQRKQMTTFGGNINVIEIDGKFDDCQSLVKKAFMDDSLSAYNLSSANSINIGRLLPQSVYYFRAWSELSSGLDDQTVFSVPCGNFGNVCGGIIAWKMGLPVKRFVIATNENDEVPEFLRTGLYNPVIPSKNCISSAMNVGHPSNLARVVAIYGGVMDEKGRFSKLPDLDMMRGDLYAISVSDHLTRETIKQFYHDYGMILEPHGAVSWYGLTRYNKMETEGMPDENLQVCLETAHPAKFGDEIRTLLKIEPDLPVSLSAVELKKEEYIKLANDYSLLRKHIIRNY